MRLLRAALVVSAALALGGVRAAAAQQAAPRRPPQMLHPAAGKQDCLSCHGRGANEHITSVPEAHKYANGACAMCHKPIAATPTVPKHALDDEHGDCRKCHQQAAEGATPAPGAAPAPPASHASFHVSTCKLCHAPAAGPPGGAGGGDAR